MPANIVDRQRGRCIRVITSLSSGRLQGVRARCRRHEGSCSPRPDSVRALGAGLVHHHREEPLPSLQHMPASVADRQRGRCVRAISSPSSGSLHGVGARYRRHEGSCSRRPDSVRAVGEGLVHHHRQEPLPTVQHMPASVADRQRGRCVRVTTSLSSGRLQGIRASSSAGERVALSKAGRSARSR
jgi:hypothetical protein